MKKFVFLFFCMMFLSGVMFGESNPYVIIQTNKGAMMIELFSSIAPKTAENFIKLIDTHFYDGLTFHRYVPGFVIQGGDPTGTGRGGPGYTLPAEISNKKHILGTVAMARLPDSVNPEKRSSGSQFYICLAPQPHLDGNYTIFGQVVEGIDVVMNLRKGDRMLVLTWYRNKDEAYKAYKLLKNFYQTSAPYNKY